jgi:hypothetical protein
MAHKKKCPYCDKMTDNQKKGMSGDNQRYKCNECGKQWTEGVTGKTITTTKTKTPTKKSVVSEKKGTTVIKVNNNEIKTLKGQLSVDEALDVAAEYFKEIQKDKVTVSRTGDQVIYAFQIQTGRKG